MKNKLLTREQFKQFVFERDNHKCVFCNATAIDAHHILDRKLFIDNGYYLNNGVSVCSNCHILCEKTLISVKTIYEKLNISKNDILLPEHFYIDENYDKWGNIILSNGQRLKGELFYDENVQKILTSANLLSLFSDYVKYPRTYHLPWSIGRSDDDKVLNDLSCFENKDIVVTTKMDGENTTMYKDFIHARSINSSNHESRTMIKQIWAKIRYELGDLRICGENLFAKHSIEYENLKSYFYGFSIWDKNICLNWNETIEYFKILNITPVDVIYEGKFDIKILKEISNSMNLNINEGYVIRNKNQFEYRDFSKNVAKFVRQNHVQTDSHWLQQKLEKNKLKI